MPVTSIVGGLPVDESRGLVLDAYGIHWCSQPTWQEGPYWDLCTNCGRLNFRRESDFQSEHDLTVHCQDLPLRLLGEREWCGCVAGQRCERHHFELRLNGLPD